MSFREAVGEMDAALVDAFGMLTAYTPQGGSPVEVSGIFERAYVPVDAGLAGVQSEGPAIFYRLQDLPVDPATDVPSISVDGNTYRVTEVHKDGDGGVRLILHR